MFGINGAELLVLVVVALVVVGPERMPRYAEQLAAWVRSVKRFSTEAKDRLAAEMGEDEVDWASLDPRRYDPRRIVREALLDDSTPTGRPAATAGRTTAATAATAGMAVTGGAVTGGTAAGGASSAGTSPAGAAAAPFDDEAT